MTQVLQTQHVVPCDVGASFLVVVEQFCSNKEVGAARGALAMLAGEWARSVFCQWRDLVQAEPEDCCSAAVCAVQKTAMAGVLHDCNAAAAKHTTVSVSDACMSDITHRSVQEVVTLVAAGMPRPRDAAYRQVLRDPRMWQTQAVLGRAAAQVCSRMWRGHSGIHSASASQRSARRRTRRSAVLHQRLASLGGL